MHGHGEKPFLCTFEGCERGVPGNGFPRHWNLCDHMKRFHNRSPSPLSIKPQPRAIRKRKCVHNTPPPGASSGSPSPDRLPEHRTQYARHLSGLNVSLRASHDVSDYDYEVPRYGNVRRQGQTERLRNDDVGWMEDSYTHKYTHAPPSNVLSPAQKQFRDKAEELMAMVKEVQNLDDRDALESLRAAQDCLKVVTDEVMKICNVYRRRCGDRNHSSNRSTTSLLPNTL